MANGYDISEDAGIARPRGDSLLPYYDGNLAAHGDTALGAGWPNEADRDIRFDVILEMAAALSPNRKPVLCDLGCGTGEMLRRIRERKLDRISYVGVDLSEAALQYARRKFTDVPFRKLDVLSAPATELEFLECDVLVANGLFTVRAGLSDAEMWAFMTAVIERVWPLVRCGLVFNVMSAAVDWSRDDLFHLSYDTLAQFLHRIAGRAIGFRADYGLYEYMAYASKTPLLGTSST